MTGVAVRTESSAPRGCKLAGVAARAWLIALKGVQGGSHAYTCEVDGTQGVQGVAARGFDGTERAQCCD